MLAKVETATVVGVAAVPVTVEVDVADGGRARFLGGEGPAGGQAGDRGGGGIWGGQMAG